MYKFEFILWPNCTIPVDSGKQKKENTTLTSCVQWLYFDFLPDARFFPLVVYTVQIYFEIFLMFRISFHYEFFSLPERSGKANVESDAGLKKLRKHIFIFPCFDDFFRCDILNNSQLVFD